MAHECILDLRELTARTGVTAEDVAKRLIDYGFHAPTLAFPVAGTLMVEPTESEDLDEIDRFITAMIAIRAEIDQVANGDFTVEDSPLRNAPHTAAAVISSDWARAYPREQAVFPVHTLKQDKYFPPVGRIDGAAGRPQPDLLLPALEASRTLRDLKTEDSAMTENYTALYEEHKKLGASFTDFGGWQMPLKYSSELAEHHAVRNAAGLFDLSHMGEVWVTGPDAAAFLDYALVGKISAMAVGKAKYSLICNEDGGIIDDLIVYRRRGPTARTGSSWCPTPATPRWLPRPSPSVPPDFDVVVEDVSAETSLIAVQGPKAEEILLRLVPAAQHELVTGLKYYAAVEVPFLVAGASQELLLARTGYTGEDGFEIFVANDDAAALWQALVAIADDGELTPAGLASRDSLRLEAGMPLYGNELSLEGDPFAAGLGPVVALSKEGDFVGKAALAARRQPAPVPPRAGSWWASRASGRRAGRGHYPVLKDGNVVGEVTSGQPSPTLGYPVAMAYVDVEFTEPGTALDIDLRGKTEPFEVVALPFYKRSKVARLRRSWLARNPRSRGPWLAPWPAGPGFHACCSFVALTHAFENPASRPLEGKSPSAG